MKPTPGPWELDDDRQHIDGFGVVVMHRVVAPDGRVVVEFSNAGCNEIVYEDDGEGAGRHYDQQAMANATLIAAAPDLEIALDDLLFAMEQAQHLRPTTPHRTACIEQAKAALAKARGKV